MERWLEKYWWTIPIAWVVLFSFALGHSSGATAGAGIVNPGGFVNPITRRADGHYYDANGQFVS
jgi:hypothetical protein